MEKLLSIVIPSFNMEAYLERCLNSLIVEDESLRKLLEIIVVNDGSTDSTSQIAHRYAEKYPDIISVIDKKNGHYGSCINAALPLSKGKYFRILDADDTINNDGLSRLLKELQSVDVDVVFTPHAIISDNVIKQSSVPQGVEYGKIYDLSNSDTIDPGYVFMHQISYRTGLLRDIGYRQTEKVCYTDNEYVAYPIGAAKTIIFFDFVLYEYRLGRDEQSMAPKSYYKNRRHQLTVAENIRKHPRQANPNAIAEIYRFRYLFGLYQAYFYNSLLVRRPTKSEREEIKNTLSALKQEEEKLYNRLLAERSAHLRYINLWLKSPLLADIIFWPIRVYRFHRYYS